MVTPAARREAIVLLQERLEVSERRACTMIGICRMTVRYRSQRPNDGDLRERMKALADERRRFDYRRLHILLRRGRTRPSRNSLAIWALSQSVLRSRRKSLRR
jgi:putative transposase